MVPAQANITTKLETRKQETRQAHMHDNCKHANEETTSSAGQIAKQQEARRRMEVPWEGNCGGWVALVCDFSEYFNYLPDITCYASFQHDRKLELLSQILYANLQKSNSAMNSVRRKRAVGFANAVVLKPWRRSSSETAPVVRRDSRFIAAA
eukprot:3078710-Rhodomonas_salina.1